MRPRKSQILGRCATGSEVSAVTVPCGLLVIERYLRTRAIACRQNPAFLLRSSYNAMVVVFANIVQLRVNSVGTAPNWPEE